MAALAADRHLLFGLLALQNGLIDQGALVAAFQAWSLDKTTALADHLIARGDLDADDRSAVEALVARHLKKHGGDPDQSLAAMNAGRSTRESLSRVGDGDVGASLSRLGTMSTQVNENDDRTGSYAVGTATSDGQRFRVLRPHAKGGLGAVFVALDGELHREVALKQILDHHADDPTSRQRFLVEAEITGGLEHPGIVPVYGLGTYGDGRPYYAMRFIRGDSLKEAIEHFHADKALENDPGRRSLEVRKLLRRFMDVCDAIHYAHSRGVLHRDIKPGNIIVGKYGETLVVDWGLAKPLGRVEQGSEAGERTLMPPSASGSAETLPGSALGTPSFMSPEQARGDLQRLGPRSDVYSLGATLYCLLTGKPPVAGSDVGAVLGAVQRGDVRPPRQLDPAIDRPLEAICLRAMALEPDDRYATPRALAEDVERWMADEPVSAHRERISGKLARWARRHRASVRAAALALAIIAALATTAALVVDQARRREEAARKQETAALISERAAKAEAQENLAMAARAVDDYFTKISENTLLKRQDAAQVRDLRSLRKELLEVALDYYTRLAGRRSPAPALRAEQAAAYTRVGRISDEIGSKEATLGAFQQAESIRRELADLDPADAARRRELALSQMDVAATLDDIGRPDQALREYARSEEILEGLVQANPADAELKAELARAYNGGGIVLRSLGRSKEALAAFERGRSAVQRMVDARPGNAEDLRRLAMSRSNIGLLLDELGRTDEAIIELEKSRSISQSLLDADPNGSGLQDDLAACDNNLGLVFSHGGRFADALAAMARGRVILRRLLEAHPSVVVYRRDLATNHVNSGNAHSALGHPAEALREFEQARSILRPMADADPSDLDTRRNLAATLYNIGDSLRATGKPAEASEAAGEACKLLEAFSDRGPFDEFILASAHDLWADLLDKPGKPPLAGDPASRDGHIRQAMTALRRAIAGGYRVFDPNNFSALRGRPEFQDLMRDLAFPDWPFADAQTQ